MSCPRARAGLASSARQQAQLRDRIRPRRGWEGWFRHLPGGAGYPAGDLCWVVARVLVGNGLTAPRRWAVRGRPGPAGHLQAAEQVAQRLGVAVECCAAVAGESDRGDGHGPVAGLLAADVVGIFEFAQVDDQVAGGEPDHVLQAGEGERVTVGQCRQRRDYLQPGGDMDQRVELAGGHRRTTLRRCCQTMTAALPRSVTHRPTPATAHAPAGRADRATAPVTATASPTPHPRQSARTAVMPAQASPAAISGTVTGYRP